MNVDRKKSWIDQLVNYAGEYLAKNPGCSPRTLTCALQDKFMLSEEMGARLAEILEGKLSKGKAGLGAIELNVTFNCNLTCEYCFVHRKSPLDRMNIDTAKRAIDMLMNNAAFPSVVITLIGGEPLLEFELIKEIVPYALDSAKERSLQVVWAVTTNGTLINEEILRYFAQHQISLMISIDGGPETHDRYRVTRSGEGSWQRIAEAIPLIKKYQPWLGARMTVSTEAIDSMREDFLQIVNLGINQLIIAPAQGEEVWDNQQIEKYGINLMQILGDYHRLKQQGVPLYIEEFEKDEYEDIDWGCRAGKTSLAVAPNGDVSPCSKLLGLISEEGRYIVGNVNLEVNFELLEPFRNPLSKQPIRCKSCTRTCAGGCFAVNFEQTGDHFTASEETCLFWVVCQEAKRASKLMTYGNIQG